MKILSYRRIQFLKVFLPIILLAGCTVFVWGKWVEFSTAQMVLAQQLKERNEDVDQARETMASLVKDSNTKITKLQVAHLIEINTIRQTQDRWMKHQREDNEKFTTLLRLYIDACFDKKPTAPEFKISPVPKNKDDKN